ncbi:uncharacterized protein si:dkey-30c15.13 isoform X2 [Phyllopteryx taeniolatus]|uniref:uncharacterized protein si:dkey-30c15.13 isoform X2 n=1 Tax=Phyllopteryx taeniolatus TaxID=161469 RepID=UPI002AD586BC|nr:uncharacterized protein si:dkey-30c15.13 isoform X2 [Phyllopteryx taeniolatus]
MRENMFQEGLYQVYFKEHPQTTRPAAQGDLHHARIHRWFSSVVNTRLLVSGVVQFLSGAVCVLTTVCHACVSYDCSVAMTTSVWSSLLFMAAGCVAVEVQRKPNKLKPANWFLPAVSLLPLISAASRTQHDKTGESIEIMSYTRFLKVSIRVSHRCFRLHSLSARTWRRAAP